MVFKVKVTFQYKGYTKAVDITVRNLVELVNKADSYVNKVGCNARYKFSDVRKVG